MTRHPAERKQQERDEKIDDHGLDRTGRGRPSPPPEVTMLNSGGGGRRGRCNPRIETRQPSRKARRQYRHEDYDGCALDGIDPDGDARLVEVSDGQR